MKVVNKKMATFLLCFVNKNFELETGIICSDIYRGGGEMAERVKGGL